MDTIYYPITFASAGSRTVTAKGYVTGELSPFASATIHVIARPKVNRPPIWTDQVIGKPDTLGVPISLTLADKCTDPDGDALTYVLLPGTPAGDTVTGSTYSFTPAAGDTGMYTAHIVARDPDNASDTLTINLTISAGDKTPPVMKRITPPNDSLAVSSSSYQITFSCKDESSIASVKCFRESDSFPVARSNDTLYSTTVTGLRPSAWNIIRLIAIDSAPAVNRSTLNVYLKYDNDSTGPAITRVNPAKDSASTNASSYTIMISCTDSSCVASVIGTLGLQPFIGTKGTNNTWTISITGLTVNTVNTVVITATDSSLKANQFSLTFYIKYDPTMLDSIGPTIIQKSGPVSGVTVANAAIEIVDSVGDPSGIDSVYWTRNSGTKKFMLPVTGNTGQYSLKDTLNEGTFDTLTVTAVDNTTRRNRSTQTTILKYIKAPVITVQPASQTVCAGSQAIFSITATGTAPLLYQWRTGATDPANITGAIFPRCTLNNVSADVVLSCVVSNQSSTSATSNLCTLTVNTVSTTPAAAASRTTVGPDSSSTLSISAGTLGTGASWKWYSGSCGGTAAGTDTSITVTPSTTTTYFVRAEGGCQTTECAFVQITVVYPPAAPTLVSPGNDSNGVATNTTLTWNAVTGAAGYSLQVATSAAFADPVINVTDLASNIRNVTLSNSKRYYWRVCASNQFGQGPWKTDSFITMISWTSLGPTGANSIAGGGNGNLYIGTDSGVFRSTNNGNTWAVINNGLTNLSIQKIYADGSNVFILCQNAVFRSTDYGNSWSISADQNTIGEIIYNLTIAGTSIYACSMQKIILSNDNGLTWTYPSNTGLISIPVYAIAAEGNSVYTAQNYSKSGIYFSNDKADNFSLIGLSGQNVSDMCLIEGTLFASTEATGIYATNDNGSNWKVSPSSPTTAFDISGDGSKIVSVSDAGAFFSSNKGQSWVTTDNLPGVAANCVCVHNGYIFVGTALNGVFRSPLP